MTSQNIVIPNEYEIDRNEFWQTLYINGAVNDFVFADNGKIKFRSRGFFIESDTILIFEKRNLHRDFLSVCSTTSDISLCVSMDTTYFRNIKELSDEAILIEMLKHNESNLLEQWNAVPYSSYTTAYVKCFVYLFTYLNGKCPVQKIWMFDPWFLDMKKRKKLLKENDRYWDDDSTFIMQEEWRFR